MEKRTSSSHYCCRRGGRQVRSSSSIVFSPWEIRSISTQSSFCFKHGQLKIVSKKFLAIYFIAGVDEDANQFAVCSLFAFFFQTLHEYFGDIRLDGC
jgi:hypothetical protein